MKTKFYIFGLLLLTVSLFLGCTKDKIEVAGNGKLYLNNIQFSGFSMAESVAATIYAKFYTATDTSSSLVISESNSHFTIPDPNKHTQVQGYNLSDKIKKIELTITFNMGDYAAKKVNIENLSFEYNGKTILSSDNVSKESGGSAISIFVLDPIEVNFD